MNLGKIFETKQVAQVVPSLDMRPVTVSVCRLPSPLRLIYAYNWLSGYMMGERRTVLIAPPSSCRFLEDWLDSGDKREYDREGKLPWSKWNRVYSDVKRRVDYENLKQTSRTLGFDETGEGADSADADSEDFDGWGKGEDHF